MRAFVLAAVMFGGAIPARAETTAPIFRVFLTDGTALACWGEYARVADTLVLTIPIGAGARRTYEFLSLPVSKVDMDKTERYAEAVRAAQFASTRGAAEFAELQDRLSKQLAAIPLLPDPAERVAAAESVRQQLLDWAATSHGYRAADVHRLLEKFDATIVGVRVAAGESRFAINLSAGMAPPAPPKLRAAPGAAETVSLAVKAAAATGNDEVRKAILRRARAAAAALRGTAGETLRALVAARLAAEARVDSLYRWLVADVTRLATRAVDRGDARAIDQLRERVRATDRRWGRQRPPQVTGLLAALDASYDAAAEQRLVLDQWESVRLELDAYKAKIAPLIAELDRLRPLLDAIADLAGTPVTDLVRAQAQTGSMLTTVAGIPAPEGAANPQRLLAAAIERADTAVTTRRNAVATRQLSEARAAADAASGARARLVQLKAALASMILPPKAIR